jgi:hypothetical protein
MLKNTDIKFVSVSQVKMNKGLFANGGSTEQVVLNNTIPFSTKLTRDTIAEYISIDFDSSDI